MNCTFSFCTGFLLLLAVSIRAEEPPREWIDPATGHRVLRLSDEPGSSSLYFHQNAYTPEGDKLIIWTPAGLSTVDLKTRALELVVPGGQFSVTGSSGIEVSRVSRNLYYSKRVDGQVTVFSTHLDTKQTKKIATLPFAGTFGGINADETYLIGAANLNGFRRGPGPRNMKLFSVRISTGEIQTFHPSTNWLNHVQCSPSDPDLVLFCHEGPWHEVDRVWTIRRGADSAQLMHQRTMTNEIAGHEFFSKDGKWIWYDLQTPRSAEFWLAGVNLETGERLRYPIKREEWSVHYNISADGKLFAGDGGGPKSVANHTPLPERRRLNPPGNGQWIYLFKPKTAQPKSLQVAGETVQIGELESERLVDMSSHDYDFEPNVTFTPDGKWIVFRSNMHGPRHVYAVEIAREEKAAPAPAQ